MAIPRLPAGADGHVGENADVASRADRLAMHLLHHLAADRPAAVSTAAAAFAEIVVVAAAAATYYC